MQHRFYLPILKFFCNHSIQQDISSRRSWLQTGKNFLGVPRTKARLVKASFPDRLLIVNFVNNGQYGFLESVHTKPVGKSLNVFNMASDDGNRGLFGHE